jgi:hypothetical protein
MKRTKIFLLAGLIFTMGTAVEAQQDNDPKAKAILDELSAKTKTYTTIKQAGKSHRNAERIGYAQRR